MDTPNPDGRIFVSPIGNAQAVGITSAGLGLYSVPVGAAATVNLDYIFNSLMLRYGMSDDAQQQYGQGAPGSAAGSDTAAHLDGRRSSRCNPARRLARRWLDGCRRIDNRGFPPRRENPSALPKAVAKPKARSPERSRTG